MTEKIICEKCGAVMTPLDPERPIGMECPECGWGWVTSYIEPKAEDATIYSIILEQGNNADFNTATTQKGKSLYSFANKSCRRLLRLQMNFASMPGTLVF